jgi:Ca-activated chloride channel family protein
LLQRISASDATTGGRTSAWGYALAIALSMPLAVLAEPARSTECGLELVLAMDVSRSVVNTEYNLQMRGLAEAFRNPQIIEAATWTPGGVMATVTQWSGPESQAQTVPWTRLTDAASMRAFADAIEGQQRLFFAAYTAVGEALVHANSLSATNPLRCTRRVIDISGDGASNRGQPPRPVADALAANGVTVNGLVIRGAWPDPAEFYQRNVIRGAGAFLEVAESFTDYAVAMRRKLLREFGPQMAER